MDTTKPEISYAEASQAAIAAGSAARQTAGQEPARQLLKGLKRPLVVPGLGVLVPPMLGHTLLMGMVGELFPAADSIIYGLALAKPEEIYALLDGPGENAEKASKLRAMAFQATLQMETSDVERIGRWLESEFTDIAGDEDGEDAASGPPEGRGGK